MCVRGALALLLLVFASATVTAETILCDIDYYNANATFRNVALNASMSYVFSCEYSQYKTTAVFIDSSLDEVPKRLFDTFQNLHNATLAQCNITQINRYCLERASSLQILDLSRNALQELRSNVFAGASALTVLDLAFNRIDTIDAKAFHSLPNLQVLYLRANRLRQLGGGVFAELAALRHVFLDQNQLELVEGGLFAANKLLKNVLLQNNRISVVDESAFGNEDALLEVLSLKNNRLAKLDLRKVYAKTVFLSNNKLEELYLGPWIVQLFAENNQIKRIESNRTLPMAIETLSLKNNSLTSLESIGRLRSLKILDLTNNTLGALAMDSFAQLSQLEQLRLERTGISNLQHGTFAQQENLEWLDLSYNGLDRLDLDILISSSALRTLFLDGNRLRSLDYASLKQRFPKLAELGLTDNNWNCSFLASLVRYCNEHQVTLVKDSAQSPPDVLRQTNVKGIFCFDEKNPAHKWNTTVQHLLATNTSEDGALQAMLRAVADDIQRFGADHAETANRTDSLQSTVADLMRRQLALENRLLDLHQSLLDLRLELLANRTNMSDTAGTDELRLLIHTVNNVTLERQALATERLDVKINAQSYRLDQALDTARANSDKLTVLGKRIEQWIGGLVSSPPGAHGLLAASNNRQQQQQSGDRDGGESKGLLIAVLVMVCVLTGLLAFGLFRGRTRSYGVERRRYTNRDSSLTTIVDNDI